MDIEEEIKEENPVSDDVASPNEREFFHEVVTKKRNSDAVLLEEGCDVAIKSETPFTRHRVKQIKCETSNWEIDRTTELEQHTLVSDFGSQNEGVFLPEDPVMNYNSDHELVMKIEIKEEPWWLETESPSVCDDIKDGSFAPVASSRLCMETVSGTSSGKAPLPATEVSRKECNGKDRLEYQDQKSDVTEMPAAETHLSVEFSKCNDLKEMYMYLKQNNLFGKKHKCNVCAQEFSWPSHLKRHNFIHESNKTDQCKTFDKSFTRLSNLKTHYLVRESKRSHQCKTCDKSFTLLSSLKTHTLIHEDKKPYHCKTCDKRFTQSSTLKGHNLIHEGKRPHQCKTCDKSFTHLSNLKRHNLIHEGKKPHQCKTCDKRFTQLSNLKTHNLIHESKKAHKCKVCGKRFTHLSHLKTHILIHEGKKPHKCKTCGKSFTQLSGLKAHNLIHEAKKQ